MNYGTWQPIETAPKDGSAFLAYGDDLGMTVIYWRNACGWQLLFVGGYAEDAEWYEKPTHWMPLPPPPEVAQSVPQNGNP